MITKLTISKNEFNQELENRIELGTNLLNEDIDDRLKFKDFKDQYENWNDYNFELLKQSFNDYDNEYLADYNTSGYTYFGDIISDNKDNFVLEKKDLIKAKIKNLIQLKNKLNLIKSTVKENKATSKQIEYSKTKIFIVHGHDNGLKEEVARFIEKLNFEPIILHEKASSGKTIIEKIEKYSNVGFGIVLYTPCDVGSTINDKKNLKSRARQNVVFEHGYLIGKIGRDKVCALVKDDVETPNDISGVVYISIKNNWKMELAKEMKVSGYDIDMNLFF